jgi:transcriptional regulator with XRE-family HTH domain
MFTFPKPSPDLSIYINRLMERNKFLISLGSQIRFIRKQKKLTQQSLSAMCEIEKANLSRIESGITNPTVLTLFKMSKAMEVGITDFFTGTM